MITRRRDDGFSLVEILVAMFIFAIGVMGVLSMFPVAMKMGSDAIGNMRAIGIGRSGIAQTQFDCSASVYEIGTLIPASDSDAICSVAFAGDRSGWFLTTLAPGDPPGAAHEHCRLIVYGPAGSNAVTVYPPWNQIPEPDTKFVVTRLGLPDILADAEPRDGYVGEWTTDGFRAGWLNPNMDDLDVASWSCSWNPPVIPAGPLMDHPGYFVLFTSGPASGRILRILEHNPDPINGDEFVCEGLDAESMRIEAAKRPIDGGLYNYKARNATTFRILGTASPFCTFHPASDRAYSINSFGVPRAGVLQAYSDVHFVGDAERFTSEYSSVMIYGAADTDGLVEVVALTFRNYDSALPVFENKRAAGYITGYINRPH